MANLTEVEGIGEAYAAKLTLAGIGTTGQLLEAGASPKGRKALAERSGIPETLVLRWVNHADLQRVKGVGSQYADLLEEAGVDTVPDLAGRNAEHLHQKLVDLNAAKKLVRQLPTLAQVTDWVVQAKGLPRIVEY
jgi:predicted flap endonuclease-1-like 5' DNA nuclease